MNDEQAEELGALESIYPDIIQKHSDGSFDVFISAILDQNSIDGIRMNVLFTEHYPNDAPILTFKPFGSTSNHIIEEVKQVAHDIVNRSLNSPMTFDIIEAIREYLEKLTIVDIPKAPEIFRKVYDKYTSVSLETFLSWKKAYDEEQKELERLRMEAIKFDIFINGLTYAEVWSKPTGKQLFEGGEELEVEEELKDEDIEVVS
ncbi:hypothetical protein SteCoe_10186 [Stentor coeruleus]|uniref:RWD domain-containing protein n=1 Tax=Stentor coeruleus TaxID=5963 RepID=A0A1R2CFZ9_9CILI|nr:hypothetical protein SteCoe_10186 [Stentor coeruleus]